MMMAAKKVGGSCKNSRDSIGRRLGIKINNLQKISPGNIIVRQRGKKIKSGLNTYYGKDHTIHSFIEGAVKFYKRSKQVFVCVI